MKPVQIVDGEVVMMEPGRAYVLKERDTVTLLFDPNNFDVVAGHGYRVIEASDPAYQRTIDEALRNNRQARAYEVERSLWKEFLAACERHNQLEQAIRNHPPYSVTWHARLHRGEETLSEREISRFGGP